MFWINQKVTYTYIKFGDIVEIHYDDAPNLYYTINLSNTDRQPQTTAKNLQMIKKIDKENRIEPYNIGDKIIYIKNIITKIYDINNNGKEPLYKIYFNNSYKYVKNKKLNKI